MSPFNLSPKKLWMKLNLLFDKIKRPTNHKIHWSLSEKFIDFKIDIKYRFQEFVDFAKELTLYYFYSQLALCSSLSLSATIAMNSEFVGFALDIDTV